MRRRSKSGDQPTKARRRKTTALKHGNALKIVRPRSSSVAREETKVARLTRERDEAFQQQTATAEVLKVIGRSTFDLLEVLNTLVESAARLCEADKAVIVRPTGKDASYRSVANYGHTPGFVELVNRQAFRPDRGSVTGRVLLEAKSVHIQDVLADPEYTPLDLAKVGDFRTILGVPLLRERIPIGVFLLQRAAVRPFTERQIKLVETFADQAVIAIENTRLFEAEQRRTRELTESLEQQTATSEVLQVISSSPGDLEPVFAAMLEKAVHICEAKFGSVYRCEAGTFRFVANHNAPPALAEQARRSAFRPSAKHYFGRMLATKAVVHVADLMAEQGYIDRRPEYMASVELGGVRTYLMVPILKESELIGAFIMGRQEVRSFTDKQIELVKNFAAQAVIAIDNARLLNELRESLERQTATSEVLGVISRSNFNLQPILQSVVDTAARLCRAEAAGLFRLEDGLYRFAAGYSLHPDYLERERKNPIAPGPGTVVGRAAVMKGIARIDDALTDPLYEKKDDARIGGYRSMIGVPLMRDGEPIGGIGLARCRVEPFSEREIELVSTFADQAVIAIENVRLFEAEQERSRELAESLEQQTATSEVLRVISASPGELQPVFDAMLENAVRICDATYGNIYSRDIDIFRLVASHKTPPAFTEYRTRNPMTGSGAHWADPMLRSKTQVHIADLTMERGFFEREPSFVAAVELGRARSALAVPMLKEGEIIGAFALARQEVRPFTEKQIALVTNLAAQAVIAVENTRLLSELRRRTDELGRSVEELRALGEVSQAVNSTLDLETVLSTIVAKAVQLSGTEAGAIYVFDDLQRTFHLRATYGMDQELIEALTHQRIGLDDSTVVQTLAEGDPVQVADLRQGAASGAAEIVQRAGFRALLVAPLLRAEEIVGLLVVRRRAPGAFPQNTVELIKTFAAQSAVAIENARLFNGVQASLEDLRTTQDRLVQTQKLASLGQLTAGIAHEIKNPLNFVNNFSSVSAELLDELDENLGKVKADASTLAEIAELANTLRDNLEKVVQHGKRADAIVKNMLLHSREGSGERRPVDINSIIEEAVNLAYHGARAEKQGFNITLERCLDPAAGELDCFPQEITRVLLNLISNGFYAATKRKGQTTDDDFEPKITAATKNLGDRLEIRIRDNGTGISPEVREKMFNPFFTTKPAGEGTGLGLSISHDIIVKQHGGSIEVESQPGEYTEVRIQLPRAAPFVRGGRA